MNGFSFCLFWWKSTIQVIFQKSQEFQEASSPFLFLDSLSPDVPLFFLVNGFFALAFVFFAFLFSCWCSFLGYGDWIVLGFAFWPVTFCSGHEEEVLVENQSCIHPVSSFFFFFLEDVCYTWCNRGGGSWFGEPGKSFFCSFWPFEGLLVVREILGFISEVGNCKLCYFPF